MGVTMDADVLAALGERNRLRIVELLSSAPRSVGEVVRELRLRQPQVTKHLQTLQRAGLVTMHPLGRRRIYALRREPLRELRAWAAGFETDHPSERILERYERSVDTERRRLARGERTGRTLTFERTIQASPARIWRAWTTAAGVRRWWFPEHFSVAECEVRPVPGGALRIVLQEGDGTRHTSAGVFLAVDRPRELDFQLSPLGPDGAPLFATRFELRLRPAGRATRLDLAMHVSDVSADAAPALAGLEIGWRQLLDHLEAEVTR